MLDSINLDSELKNFNPGKDPFASNKFCTEKKDPKTSHLENIEDSALKRYIKKNTILLEKIAEIGLTEKNEQIRIITKRTFNAIQFLEFVSETEIITDLKIAIYSINYFAAKILIELIDTGRIQKAEILMSNLRNAAHREKEEIIKNSFIKNEKIDLFFCSSHAKVFSCATESGNYYTVEGSGNLAYNSRIEQYIIDNDKEMYEFTCEWFSEIREYLKNKKEYQTA